MLSGEEGDRQGKDLWITMKDIKPTFSVANSVAGF